MPKTRNKLRVLYVLDFFYPHVGGVPTVFKNLCQEVAKLGHDVTVVTSKERDSKDFEVWNGIKIHRFGRTREQFLMGASAHLMSSRDRYDIVHTCTYSAMIPSFLFSSTTRTPSVISVYEVWSLKEWVEFASHKGPFYFLEERTLFSLPFDKYIIAAEHTRKDLKEIIGVPDSKMEKIMPGIDSSIFSPRAKRDRKAFRKNYGIGDDEVVGCFVGKATVFKGIEYMLDGLEAALKKSKNSFRFIFLLSRSHESGYKNFIKRVHSSEVLTNGIILAEPSVEHSFASKLIGASDFLVMPSLTEGFGLAAAESISIGTPVVVTRGTCLEEIVEEGRNALLVRQRSGEDIERALLRMVNDGALRRRMSKPKKFSAWSKVAQDHVKAYMETIEQRRGS
ncbi:MAG: glycosyltransferase family 4 protein [Candidatus Aenigmarchaeota archaeon]|nr:glycosyltransferase family 4 protein [Candidatus Aenigmarchaeota archaeon]